MNEQKELIEYHVYILKRWDGKFDLGANVSRTKNYKNKLKSGIFERDHIRIVFDRKTGECYSETVKKIKP